MSEREHEIFRNGAGKPVIALDIDGTLADYHGWFLRFAELYFGRKMPEPQAINPGFPLHRHMDVRLSEYRDCKLAYRQGGMKRSMPAYEGAGQLTRRLRLAGAEVWICTTRPYLRLDNIDPDTREWLRRNKIVYDAVIFGDDKYQELVRQVSADRVVAVADDLVEHIIEADAAGIKNIYLRSQPYNRSDTQWGSNPPDFYRFSTCEELEAQIMTSLELWRDDHPNEQ